MFPGKKWIITCITELPLSIISFINWLNYKNLGCASRRWIIFKNTTLSHRRNLPSYLQLYWNLHVHWPTGLPIKPFGARAYNSGHIGSKHSWFVTCYFIGKEEIPSYEFLFRESQILILLLRKRIHSESFFFRESLRRILLVRMKFYSENLYSMNHYFLFFWSERISILANFSNNCYFVEHIPYRMLPHFLQSFSSGRKVVYPKHPL